MRWTYVYLPRDGLIFYRG